MKLKNKLLFLIAALFLFYTTNTFATGKYDINRISKSTDELIKKYLALDIFSGVVLIAEDGIPFYQKAFGLADREKKIPNTKNTKFDIGSMNKSFTKVAILQLVQEGKINLDDNLGKYLNGFNKTIAENVTIEQLLSHKSGFGDYHFPGYFDLPLEKRSISGLLTIIKKMELLFAPGSDRQYSNTGYVILGAVIENATGKSYYQNIRERIIEPLGLKETYIDNKDQVPQRAIGYFKNMKGEIRDNQNELELPKPDGGFQSTVTDILKFYKEYYYGNKLLSDEIKNKEEEFRYVNHKIENGGVVSAAGGFPGANTVIFENPREKLSIVVFANMDEPVAEQLGLGILNIINNKIPKEPSLPAIQNVYKAFKENGETFVFDNFEKLTANFHPTDPKDLILNQIGYNLLFEDQVDEALSIFKMNIKLFPDIANCYDSYAEALLASGDKDGALENYKKALELNPNLPSAVKMVKELSVN